MVASRTKAVPTVVSSIQDIPLGKIRESKTNPRRFFDEAKLAELAANIEQHGVLQPILVRPLHEGEAEQVAAVRAELSKPRIRVKDANKAARKNTKSTLELPKGSSRKRPN